MAKIHIEGLKVKAHIGVYAFEKQIKQSLLLDIELCCDIKKSALSDNIDDTIDYARVCEDIEKIVAEKKYALIETLGYELAHHIDSTFKPRDFTLKLAKPGAVKQAKNVAVTLNKDDL